MVDSVERGVDVIVNGPGGSRIFKSNWINEWPSSVYVLIDNEPIYLDLDAVFGLVNHSNFFKSCVANWLRSVKEAELNGEWGANCESSVGDFSFEENGVIVTIFGTVILKVDGLLGCFEVVVGWVCRVLLLHQRNSSVFDVV